MSTYVYAQDPYAGCWFAGLPAAGKCDGRLQKCHLLPKALLKRELWQSRRWKASGRLPESLQELVWDERVWIPGCQFHHYRVDESRKLRVPRHLLPPAVEAFAAEWGLEWWLSREYGERQEMAA